MIACGKKLYFFNEAYECIDTTYDRKQCHGAVLVKGGKIVSRGRNQVRGRVMQKSVISTHAEIDAIKNLSGLSNMNKHNRVLRKG